ncbi:unnamed protein product [Spirodela intermedia]|uniref:Uncharacterized protein n=1 Tax=Spirodela intermedia TaxID=51605 RepID=A0A7I8JAM3_SPIIN|nr:unnamed protein product [Spirodela intermedia]CAA6667256.1 unnamed protein product [Spirodela intermedia]
MVIKNENDDEIQTRLTTSWRVCIDYRKLNSVTRKDHFLLPFIDQILEKLKKLILSWEKSYFMVREGVVLGHIVSERGLEVDRVKINIISKIKLSNSVKQIRSFLNTFSNEQLMTPQHQPSLWYTHIVNFLVFGKILEYNMLVVKKLIYEK